MQVDIQRRGVGIRYRAHARTDPAHVDGAVERVKGGVESLQFETAAQVDTGVVARAHMAHALGGDEPFEEFDCRSGKL